MKSTYHLSDKQKCLNVTNPEYRFCIQPIDFLRKEGDKNKHILVV